MDKRLFKPFAFILIFMASTGSLSGARFSSSRSTTPFPARPLEQVPKIQIEKTIAPRPRQSAPPDSASTAREPSIEEPFVETAPPEPKMISGKSFLLSRKEPGMMERMPLGNKRFLSNELQPVQIGKASEVKGKPLANIGNEFIFNSEARKDKSGNPVIYKLPKEDGGGEEEIAGFTSRYNPNELAQLKRVKPEERKNIIMGMIDKKTANAQKWATNPQVKGMVQDTIFHRGDGGASNIIRIAIGAPIVKNTSLLTPKEVESFNALDPLEAISALADARSKYENQIIGTRPKLAKGLQNRFNNARKYFTTQYLESNT
jgi:hypothetical protein